MDFAVNHVHIYFVFVHSAISQVQYTIHTTHLEMGRRAVWAIVQHTTLLQLVKKRKLMWFGHAVRAKGTMANTILPGKVEGRRVRGKGSKHYTS